MVQLSYQELINRPSAGIQTCPHPAHLHDYNLTSTYPFRWGKKTKTTQRMSQPQQVATLPLTGLPCKQACKIYRTLDSKLSPKLSPVGGRNSQSVN